MVTPRKSSLNPQITCHTCGGQNLIWSQSIKIQEVGTAHSTLESKEIIKNTVYNELFCWYFNLIWRNCGPPYQTIKCYQEPKHSLLCHKSFHAYIDVHVYTVCIMTDIAITVTNPIFCTAERLGLMSRLPASFWLSSQKMWKSITCLPKGSYSLQ